ncbi:arginine--tRNA ligase [Candidatus Roizmanbacteria bacterium]|nr:MAG: arginine--tRNA ligase [Candidatus Roizmanbacteria bacterium]
MLQTEIELLIIAALKSLNLQDASPALAHIADQKLGDYTTSIALKLAPKLKATPMELAQKIANSIPKSELVDRVEVLKPGFINIHVSPLQLFKQLKEFSSRNFNLSSLFSKKNKTVIVEYSSPNIAKPFTIGHLRSTIIGDAIANMLQATGYDVKRDNHVGDWGTQFGKLIYAIQEWGSLEEIERSPRPVKVLVDLYVKFHEEADKDKDLEERARKKFKLLENGDDQIRALWNNCIEWSWKEFDFIYKKLGIVFTENEGRGYGESFFDKDLMAVVDELSKKKILHKSEGAEIVEFTDEKYPPLMITKSDGASLYSTRDLATDKFRLKKYGKDIVIINEVGAEQTLYFRQLYEVERMLGWFTTGQRIHVGHGLYRFKDQKMSTRKGNTIWLEDVISEAEVRASKMGNNPSVSTSIAIASLKWNDLKHSPQQDVIFDWDQILNMQGNSGPYMLYTIVRAISILGKAGESDLENGGETPLSGDELNLARFLSKFPEVAQQATTQYLPSTLATYLFQLAQQYNVFYQTSPILKSDEKTKELRLMITAATANVLKSGLKLLGIQTVDKM